MIVPGDALTKGFKVGCGRGLGVGVATGRGPIGAGGGGPRSCALAAPAWLPLLSDFCSSSRSFVQPVRRRDFGLRVDAYAGPTRKKPRTFAQGFDPAPGYGRAHISSYYQKQPLGLSAKYELQSVRALTPELTLAYARAVFERPDGAVGVYLTIVAELVRGRWAIRHYHVSKQVGG